MYKKYQINKFWFIQLGINKVKSILICLLLLYSIVAKAIDLIDAIKNQTLSSSEIVSMIQSGEVDIFAKDRRQNTALHYAYYMGDEDVIDALISEGADENARNAVGRTPYELCNLINAIKNQILSASQIVSMIQSGKVDIFAKDRSQNTALHHAYYVGDKDVIDALISKGADEDARNARGRTPRELSKDERERFSRGVIVQESSGQDQSQQGKRGRDTLAWDSAFNNAIQSQNLNEVLRLLLHKDKKRSALDKAVYDTINMESFNRNILSALLVAGANTTLDGESVLIRAATNNDMETVSLLLSMKKDNVDVISGSETPLNIAARNGNLKMVSLLLSEGADPDPHINIMDAVLEAPLDIAIRNLHWDVAFELLNAQAHLKHPYNVFTVASAKIFKQKESGEQQKHLEKMFEILNTLYRKEIKTHTANNSDVNATHRLVSILSHIFDESKEKIIVNISDNENVFRMLLKNVDSINVGDLWTSIMKNTRSNVREDMFKAMLDDKMIVDVDFYKDTEGLTALQSELRHSHLHERRTNSRSIVSNVEMLLKYGADPKMKVHINKFVRSVSLLSYPHSFAVGILLIKHGAIPESWSRYVSREMFESESSKQALLLALKESGNLNARDSGGRTLFEALLRKKVKPKFINVFDTMIHKLIQEGADLTLQDSEGRTALSFAKTLPLSLLLIEYGVIPHRWGAYVKHERFESNKQVLLMAFKEAGAFNVQDSLGETFVEALVKNKAFEVHYPLISELIEKGVDPALLRPALDVARHLPLSLLLIKYGVVPRRWSAYLKHKRFESDKQVLLMAFKEAGAFNVQDSLGETFFDVLTKQPDVHYPLILELIEKGVVDSAILQPALDVVTSKRLKQSMQEGASNNAVQLCQRNFSKS